jgi:hypothetical protein
MKTRKIIPANYGSIPHLSTSKLTQQADKKIEMGQELILTKKTRDWKDLVIVTEKLDGSNVGIIRKDGKLLAITRSGYLAIDSPYSQHHLFDTWVDYNQFTFTWLREGWRVCGEWMAMAHGTEYNISGESPFVAFDIIDDNNQRIPYLMFMHICISVKIQMVPLLHIGQPVSVNNAIKLMGDGHYGQTDKPEGFVYRVEREGKFDFAAKWVRADKEDGKFLECVKSVWNKGFEKL